MGRFFLLFVFAAVLFYAGIVEPNMVSVDEVVITDDLLWRSWGDTKIALLADLHIDTPGSREDKVRLMLRDLQPDVIVFSGDIVQWDTDPTRAIEYISGFRAPLGVFGVLGDSDMSTGRQQCLFCHPAGNLHHLRQWPYFFRNGFTTLDLQQGRKMIIGGFSPVKDEEGDQPSPMKNLADRKSPVLLLHHFSDGWDRIEKNRPALWLAGDTHGGQIRLPEFLWQRLHLVDYPQYRAGLFTDGDHRWLYVNRGIGTSSWFPFRLGVKPEITVIRFQGGSM